jgi:electron transport complex protein RnfG
MTDKDEAKKVAEPEAEPKARPEAKPEAKPEAEPQQDSPAKLIITLTIVALVAGVALAGAHRFTKDRIAAAKARKKLASIKKVLPKCTNNPVKDAIKVAGIKGKKTEVYRCRKKQPDGTNPVVAVAIEQSSVGNKFKPYSGLIRIMVGIDAKSGQVRSYKTKKGKSEVAVVIVKHSETPGLGSKALDYDFRQAYVGKDLKGKDKTSGGKVWLTKKDNPQLGFVDAISGATITSRAVTEIVKKSLTVFNKNRTAIMTTVKSTPKAPAGEPVNKPKNPAQPKGKQP